MGRWTTLFSILLVLLVGVSCSSEEDYYSLDKFWLSLGTIETTTTLGYDFLVITDTQDTLLPVTQNIYNFNYEQGQRVLVNYTLLDEYNNQDKTYYARINSLKEVLLKDIIERTTDNTDSLGNDRTNIKQIWRSGDLLNIEFEYLGSGYYTHYINLAIDSSEPEDSLAPIDLYFLHNANGDDQGVPLNGIVSFRLNKLQTTVQDSVLYKIHFTDFTGTEQQLSGTYTY